MNEVYRTIIVDYNNRRYYIDKKEWINANICYAYRRNVGNWNEKRIVRPLVSNTPLYNTILEIAKKTYPN